MTIEQQVSNLELSKRLKELGVKQDSLFVWARQQGHREISLETLERIISIPFIFETFCALTVAELGEILKKGMIGSWKSYDKGWYCKYEYEADEPEPIKELGGADTEANARAKMLIYLIENKLL